MLSGQSPKMAYPWATLCIDNPETLLAPLQVHSYGRGGGNKQVKADAHRGSEEGSQQGAP